MYTQHESWIIVIFYVNCKPANLPYGWPNLVQSLLHTYSVCTNIVMFFQHLQLNKNKKAVCFQAPNISGWWLTRPSEKYESQCQLGLLFPIYGQIKTCSKPPTRYQKLLSRVKPSFSKLAGMFQRTEALLTLMPHSALWCWFLLSSSSLGDTSGFGNLQQLVVLHCIGAAPEFWAGWWPHVNPLNYSILKWFHHHNPREICEQNHFSIPNWGSTEDTKQSWYSAQGWPKHTAFSAHVWLDQLGVRTPGSKTRWIVGSGRGLNMWNPKQQKNVIFTKTDTCGASHLEVGGEKPREFSYEMLWVPFGYLT